MRMFSGKIDAAFVRRNSSTNFSNTIYDEFYNSYTLSPGYTDDITGRILNMCGQNTQNSNNGRILVGHVIDPSTEATYKSSKYGPTEISDVISVGYYAQAGDSGGVVFAEINNSNKVVGIQVARFNGGTQPSYSFVCKAKNICDTFGLNIY